MRTKVLSAMQADAWEDSGPTGEVFRRVMRSILQNEAKVYDEPIEIVSPEGYGLDCVDPEESADDPAALARVAQFERLPSR